jgi:2-polyprenyl-6-methoxyphenol hydroxylase-like FAD-dependent oxidoreductase
MRIVVVGGSAAGLLASLLLARARHDVVVLERDPVDPAPDVESAAAMAFRPAAPHIVQPHVVLSLCRELLLQQLPDVYDKLLAAGVAQAPLSTQMPPSLHDRTTWPGDERLTLLMTRRSTFDWVLRRAAVAQTGLTVRDGIHVTGLLARPGQPPHITGVSTDAGEFRADLVVDATGRRSSIDRWLAAVDGQQTATRWAECGVAYYSRHYRLRRSAELPGPPTTRVVAGLDEFTVGIWGADNSTMVLAVAPLVEDKRFRSVKNADVFTAVVRTVPLYAAWLGVLEPISHIFPMAGLHNTMRRLVVDGSPVATGLHAIGDTVCTTNPTLSRGLSLAMQSAVDLVDAIDQYGEHWSDLALALDQHASEHVEPFYTDQATTDAARLAALRHTILGTPSSPPPHRPDRVTYAQLRTAAPFDPRVFRAFWKIMGMVCHPDDVYTDPAVIARTHEIIRDHGSGPPIAQPSRQQLQAALTT